MWEQAGKDLERKLEPKLEAKLRNRITAEVTENVKAEAEQAKAEAVAKARAEGIAIGRSQPDKDSTPYPDSSGYERRYSTRNSFTPAGASQRGSFLSPSTGCH